MRVYQDTKIQLPGFSLALKTWQAHQSKPILCLHGKLDNAASFDLLAEHLTDFQLVSVDSPGTGYSSHYPEGVIPHWKNDAFLLLHLINILGWERFDIIAHSLGHLLATYLAILKPQQVDKIIFLDILGPKVDLIENNSKFLQNDSATYLTADQGPRTIFPDIESAIQDRMKIGNISYEAACALVNRGTTKLNDGWVWTFDKRLRCVSATLPHEDELTTMFQAIKSPVCLIRAKQGVAYPKTTFANRARAIENLTIHELQGSHHVHMDDSAPVAKIITEFLDGI